MITLWIVYIIWLVISLTCAVIGKLYEKPFVEGFCIWSLPLMFYLPFFI